jgi:predicted nucleotidyltransferase
MKMASGKSELRKIMKTLRGLKQQIRVEYKAEITGVFGSYSRGQQRANSDIDILVRFLDEATLFDLVGLGDFLEEKLGVKVDIVSEGAVRSELREQIMNEVVPV